MFTMQSLWRTITSPGDLPCSDVMVGGVVPPPCIIILWSEFVFWGFVLYLGVIVVIFGFDVPFLIFQLHAFLCLYQKTRLTSNVQFFQLIFSVKYLFGGHYGCAKSLF